MARRYDRKTNAFSREGRLEQVEYAIEAIKKTGSAIGILTNEGVVFATAKDQDESSLMVKTKKSERLYKIDDHIYCVVSGMAADCNVLLDQARLKSQRYQYAYGDKMPMEQLIEDLCDFKQMFTMYGGYRPFGAAFLFAGWDKRFGFQLYSTDPGGNYAGWKATALGTNNMAANSFLKSDYREDLSLQDAVQLALKALVKTMDTTTPSPDKIEMTTVSKDKSGKVFSNTLKQDEIKSLIDSCEFSDDKD